MIEARATVVRVETGRVWVKVEDRQDGCGRCDEPGGCRSVRLAYSIKPPTEVFSLPDHSGLRQGESVVIRMNDGAPLLGALGSYGVGACLLVAGAAVGHFVATGGREDLYALAGGSLGILIAIGFNRLLHRSRRWRGTLAMEVVRDQRACTQTLEKCA